MRRMLQRTVWLVMILGLAGWGPVRADDETDGGEGHPARDVRPIFEDRLAVRVGAQRLKYDGACDENASATPNGSSTAGSPAAKNASTALLSVLPTLIGSTQTQQPDENRFRLALGAFIMEFDTSVRVDTPLGPGTTIDLEDDLGMDSDQTQLFVSARYRFARKHSLGVAYLSIDRDSRRTLSRDIEFGDDLFTIGLDLQSFFNFELLEFNYSYALVQKPRFAFVFSAGISAIDYDLGLRAELQPGPGRIEEREDEAYPVPSFGLGVSYRFAPKWSFRSGFQYFEYSADDWEADLLVLDVSLEYFPWKNFGFGLGYNYLEIGYEESGGDALDIIYEYDGILLRAIFEF